MKWGDCLAHLALVALVGVGLGIPARARGHHPDAAKQTRSNAAREILAGRVGLYRVELHMTPRNPGADQVTLLEIAVSPTPGTDAYAGPVTLGIVPERPAMSAATTLRALPRAPGHFGTRHQFGAEGTYQIEVRLDGPGARLVRRTYIGYPTHPLAWQADLLLEAAFVVLGIGFAIWLGCVPGRKPRAR